MRNLGKTPGFTITAVLTLALGIGISTAVFTVVESVLWKPLPYPDSGNLVVVWERVKFLSNTGAGLQTGPNPRHEVIWQERANAFSALCLVGVGTRGVSFGVDHPQLVGSIRAQPNLLDLLGLAPILGRNFTPQDGAKGQPKVVIIAYSLWQRMFQGDRNAIGRQLRIGGEVDQIIGVLPQDFQFPKRNVLTATAARQTAMIAPPVEILTPVNIDPNDYGWNSDYGNWIALGRLKEGLSPRQAELELNHIQQQIVAEMPAQDRDGDKDSLLSSVQPLREAMVHDSRTGLWMLLAAVIGLVLIACVNLANAQLGRAALRQREAAVRSALGASRWQLVWSSFSESLLLASAGGAAGILLAYEAVALFKRFSPVELPRMDEIQPNPSVLLFALAMVAASAILFGIMPALQLSRLDPHQSLQQNTARAQGNRQGRSLRFSLIGAQVFGCTALLLITGLFTKSLLMLVNAERGFDSANVVAAEVNLRSATYDNNPLRSAFDDRVLNRLHALPGVTSAALVSAMPLEGETWIDGIHRPDKPLDHPPLWNMRWVSPEVFTVMHERLAAGRFFQSQDLDANNAVISESSAKAGWPGEDPIGRTFNWQTKVFTIVGVVADAKTTSLKAAPPNMVYLPYRSLPPYAAFFLVRSSQSAEAITEEVRHAIWQEDPQATIARVKTLDSEVNDSISSERFETFAMASFGVAGLLLAMLGVYGVLSYTIAGRTQEIGVRMALGATRRRIYSLTLTEVAVPVVIGLGAGWVASQAAGRLIEHLLYGVKTSDWSVTLTVAAALLSCAAMGALLPARRAASIDPMQALRAQ